MSHPLWYTNRMMKMKNEEQTSFWQVNLKTAVKPQFEGRRHRMDATTLTFGEEPSSEELQAKFNDIYPEYDILGINDSFQNWYCESQNRHI